MSAHVLLNLLNELSILMHGVISLSDATSCDDAILYEVGYAIKLCHLVLTGMWLRFIQDLCK